MDLFTQLYNWGQIIYYYVTEPTLSCLIKMFLKPLVAYFSEKWNIYLEVRKENISKGMYKGAIPC